MSLRPEHVPAGYPEPGDFYAREGHSKLWVFCPLCGPLDHRPRPGREYRRFVLEHAKKVHFQCLCGGWFVGGQGIGTHWAWFNRGEQVCGVTKFDPDDPRSSFYQRRQKAFA